MEMEKETYYTINEVAAMLKVTRKAVYDWMGSGKLEYVTSGIGGRRRITKTALDQFLHRGANSIDALGMNAEEKSRTPSFVGI